MLTTLQRIAAMMDAEKIDASPVLATGSATASLEDVSQFLDEAVTPTETVAFPPADRASDSSAPWPLPDESDPVELEPNS